MPTRTDRPEDPTSTERAHLARALATIVRQHGELAVRYDEDTRGIGFHVELVEQAVEILAGLTAVDTDRIDDYDLHSIAERTIDERECEDLDVFGIAQFIIDALINAAA